MLLERGVSLSTGFGAYVISHTSQVYSTAHCTIYDRTEYGGIIVWDPIPKNKDWEYFSFIKPVEFTRRYQDGLPGIFELVILVRTPWPIV